MRTQGFKWLMILLHCISLSYQYEANPTIRPWQRRIPTTQESRTRINHRHKESSRTPSIICKSFRAQRKACHNKFIDRNNGKHNSANARRILTTCKIKNSTITQAKHFRHHVQRYKLDTRKIHWLKPHLYKTLLTANNIFHLPIGNRSFIPKSRTNFDAKTNRALLQRRN